MPYCLWPPSCGRRNLQGRSLRNSWFLEPANEAALSQSKDAPLEVGIHELRDLIQSQARELESQRSTLRKAIGEQQQEIERLLNMKSVCRDFGFSIIAARCLVQPTYGYTNEVPGCMMFGMRTESRQCSALHQMFGSRSKYSSSSFVPPSPSPISFSDSMNSMRSIHFTILYPS